MNILFVLEYYPPRIGGVETLFETIAKGLAERGHDVRVITTRLTDYKKRETRAGVRIERIDIPYDSRSLFSLWTIPAVIRAARWADVIHTSTYNAIPPASIAGVLTRTPVIVTGHERLGKKWFSLPRISKIKAFGLYLAEHILYRFPVARIAAVSDATKRDLIVGGIRERKLTRVYNAFNDEPWSTDLTEKTAALEEQYDLEDKTVFCMFGRPGITKGLEYGIAAFPRIKQELPNAKMLLIISKSPAHGYEEVSRILDEIGRDDVIEKNDVPFSELPAHVNLADVVIVPSLTEGFGYTTLEASTLKKKIIASDAGAIPEVISGKYVLVAPANPEAIAHAAVRIVKMPIERTPEKRFPAEQTILDYESEYARVKRA